jgi:hypothetical protein
MFLYLVIPEDGKSRKKPVMLTDKVVSVIGRYSEVVYSMDGGIKYKGRIKSSGNTSIVLK